MFNSLHPDGGRISPGPRGHGNFRGDEIVSCTLANVASEVRAFKSLIFQSKTNATAQSRSMLLASSIYFLFFTHQTKTQGVKMVAEIASRSQAERCFFFFGTIPIHPLVLTVSP